MAFFYRLEVNQDVPRARLYEVFSAKFTNPLIKGEEVYVIKKDATEDESEPIFLGTITQINHVIGNNDTSRSVATIQRSGRDKNLEAVLASNYGHNFMNIVATD